MGKKMIRLLGLKGSWKWAKKQMMDGSIVRCKHWVGTLVYKVDSKENGLLKMGYFKRDNTNKDLKWENAVHHLSYEEFTDYIIFKGETK